MPQPWPPNVGSACTMVVTHLGVTCRQHSGTTSDALGLPLKQTQEEKPRVLQPAFFYLYYCAITAN